jgi:hypothetical protein
MICPDCHGQKIASWPYGGDHHAVPAEARAYAFFKCSRCAGTGDVDLEGDKLWVVGLEHRAWRIRRHESLRDCARRYGWTLAQLADMENGRVSCSDLPVLATAPKIIGEGGHA